MLPTVARQITLASLAMVGAGFLLALSSLASVELAQTVILGQTYTPDPGAWTEPEVVWGLRLVGLGTVGATLGLIGWAAGAWVQAEGGPYRVWLVAVARRRARELGHEPTRVRLARIALAIEKEREGWRPETILWWLDASGGEVDDPGFLVALQEHARALRTLAEEAMTGGELDPRIETLGTTYGAVDLATLCDRVQEAIWRRRTAPAPGPG